MWSTGSSVLNAERCFLTGVRIAVWLMQLPRSSAVNAAFRSRWPTAVQSPKHGLSGSKKPPESRHLTVLFCDLVGSTEISVRLDPEEWRDLEAEYHRAAA